MKYRVQLLVDNNHLPAVIEAAFTGKLDYDPELKVWPASQPREAAPKRKMEVLPGDVVGVKRRLPTPRSNNRQMLVEAALKTGPKRWGELRTVLVKGGLSESSLNALMGKWKKERKIVRSPEGLWSLNDAQPQAANAG